MGKKKKENRNIIRKNSLGVMECMRVIGRGVGMPGESEKHNDSANCILNVFDNFDHSYGAEVFLDSMWVFCPHS